MKISQYVYINLLHIKIKLQTTHFHLYAVPNIAVLV